MTILFLARLFYPHIGGVEKHVLEVGDKLAKKGHKIILITEKISDDDLNNWQDSEQSANQKGEIEEKIASWEIHHIPVGTSEKNKKWKIWWWFWKNQHILEKADIIHAHDVFFWIMPFLYLKKDFKKKPVFTTFHGYETKFPPDKSAITIRRKSEELSWGNICVGDFIKKWYGTHPDYVTYGGVDLGEIKKHENDKYPVVSRWIEKDTGSTNYLAEEYKTAGKSLSSKNTKKIRKEKVSILFIGRLAEDTGILAYDQAVGLLRNKYTQDLFEFVILGDGELRDYLRNASHPASHEHNIYPYIKNAHIVFSSSYLTILQVLAMKKPVIAFYDNPLKEDYLRMSPFARWISIEDSSEKIAGCVEELIQKKESIAQKQKEAYLWVSGQTWENVTQLYLKLWNRKINLR